MTLSESLPYVGRDWVDDLELKPLAKRAISIGITKANRWIRSHSRQIFLDSTEIASIHRMMFQNVFPDFAGRYRGPSPDFIAYNVTFGNRRGYPHDDVPAAMEELGRASVSLVHQLDLLQNEMAAADFQVEVIKAAAYVHCRFVEIHPFVNGNGRTSRMCINYFLRRYGLRLIAIQRPDVPDYIDAIRTWIDQRSVDHFVQFLMSQLDPE